MNKIQQYIIDIFKIDENTSATIIITIIVLLIGFLITWFVKIFNNFFIRRNNRKVFNNIITSISKSAEKQAQNFFISLECFNIKYADNFIIKIEAITHLETFANIDFNNIYIALLNGFENFFNKKKKRKYLNKAFSYIYSLKKIDDRYQKDLRDFIIKYNEYEDKRNESIEKFRILADNLFQSLNGRKLSDIDSPYFKKLDNIIFEWQKLNNRTHLYISQKGLIEKCRNLNKDYPSIPIILKFNDYLLNATHQYDNIINILNVYKNLYKSYYHLYRNSSKVLKICMRKLK